LLATRLLDRLPAGGLDAVNLNIVTDRLTLPETERFDLIVRPPRLRADQSVMKIRHRARCRSFETSAAEYFGWPHVFSADEPGD
jgi:hypothetical protein